MKKEIIKAMSLFTEFRKSLVRIFKKKEVTHMDNLDAIMLLLQEYDFKEMSVSEMIALKEKVDKRFDSILEKIKLQSALNIEFIKEYNSKR